MIGTFVFDTDALCGFAAHVAHRTAEHLGIELSEEDWPAISAAVSDYLDDQFERAAFAAEAMADLAALPVTQEGVTQTRVPQHRPEFGALEPPV